MNLATHHRITHRVRSFSGIDLLIILMSFVVCHYLYLDDLDFNSERFLIVIAALALGYTMFAALGLYRTDRDLMLDKIVSRLTFGWFTVVMLVALIAFLTKIAVDVSRVWFGLSTLLAYASLVGARLVSGVLLANSYKHGSALLSVVLVGDENQTNAIVDRVAANLWAGYRIVRVIPRSENLATDSGNTPALEKTVDVLGRFIEEQRQSGTPVAEVWIALPLADEVFIKSIINRLRDSSVDVCIVPDAFALQVMSGTAMSVADLPVVNVSDIRLSGSGELFKRLFDRTASLLAVIFLFPFMVLIAIVVKWDSPGPVLFRQHRYGVDGKEIEVWKFRSMSVQENGSELRQATRNDARVTRAGAILRKYSLDELPQFFNVLQGHMSIVGPRPHAVSHNEEYRAKIDGYMMRHKIKPGITGWAQVNGWRGETDTLEKMEKRVRYDLEYISNWSPWLDLKIILLTVLSVFSSDDVY